MRDTQPGHVADLLPAYLNGTLQPREERRVDEHLATCARCREGLASWEVTQQAVVVAHDRTPAPSTMLLDGVLARIEREEAPSHSRLSLAWQLLLGQLPLVRREIWAASAVTMAMGCLVSALVSAGASAAGSAFAIFAPIVAAVGVAFVYGPENDPSLEVALSTPTSPRLVLLARLVLVYGYDLALALAATGVLLATRGTFEPWPLVSLWIGPMLFLSALALLISLLYSPNAALVVALSLWGARLAAETGSIPGQPGPVWAKTVETLWHANALLLPLATLLLVAAFLFVPRVARQAREGAAP